jgi:hypothetical protein
MQSIQTCRHCGREFELTPAKPDLIDECERCVQEGDNRQLEIRTYLAGVEAGARELGCDPERVDSLLADIVTNLQERDRKRFERRLERPCQ